MPLEPLAHGTKNGAKPTWAPILGQSDIADTGQKFLGQGQTSISRGQAFPMGLAVSSRDAARNVSRTGSVLWHF